jgi:hypothetical protein
MGNPNLKKGSAFAKVFAALGGTKRALNAAKKGKRKK